MNVDELYKLMEDRRRDLGLSQAEVERRAFGKDGNASFQAIRRGAAPSYDRLMALGKALDLEFYFGPLRPYSEIRSAAGGRGRGPEHGQSADFIFGVPYGVVRA